MARSQRASAAAAAKRILAQAADDGPEEDNSATLNSRTRTTHADSKKRKRRDDSPGYKSEAEDESDESDVDDVVEDDDDDDDTANRKKSPQSVPSIMAKTYAANTIVTKRNKKPTILKDSALSRRIFARVPPTLSSLPACCPPERHHGADYHRPLLLDDEAARQALLAWYGSVSNARGMPWREGLSADFPSASTTSSTALSTTPSTSSPWLDPAACLAAGPAGRDALARRAYGVWISEVMAQQTRIAVVVAYWTRWMARWPTVEALAAADRADVLQVWAGLGYYSRAARLHEAAQAVAGDPELRGLLPADPAVLQACVPGVGRYTAGAIAAIVFGRAAPMVDGNVVRVLSRQLGLWADSKTDKAALDVLWAAAEALVQAVAWDGADSEAESGAGERSEDKDPPISDRPGRWGQALMELGSTVCTPKPDCAACPIQTTCRAYAEGLLLHERTRVGGRIGDIALGMQKDEDCPLCEQFPELDGDEEDTAGAKKKSAKPKAKKVKASPFFDVEDAPSRSNGGALAAAVAHARAFPLRRPKKPVRALETLVCAVRVRTTGSSGGGHTYLLHQRPPKGLLASLWQLPSLDLPTGWTGSAAARRKEAAACVRRWVRGAGSAGGCSCGGGCGKAAGKPKAKKTETGDAACTALKGLRRPLAVRGKPQELGSIPWLFSHIRQTMHVYLFEVGLDNGQGGEEEDTGTDGEDPESSVGPLPAPTAFCWASETEAEETYSMGTGMRKCWDLAKDA